MPKFNLDEYEPVEDRIRRFYSDHPDGRITADLLSDANDLGMVVVKAYVYVGEELKSTGLAYEKNGEGYVNKTSHLENCETSAIGRALANFNYAGSRRPSREEMEKVNNGNGRQDIINKIGEYVEEVGMSDDERTALKNKIAVSDTKALQEILDGFTQPVH